MIGLKQGCSLQHETAECCVLNFQVWLIVFGVETRKHIFIIPGERGIHHHHPQNTAWFEEEREDLPADISFTHRSR